MENMGSDNNHARRRNHSRDPNIGLMGNSRGGSGGVGGGGGGDRKSMKQALVVVLVLVAGWMVMSSSSSSSPKPSESFPQRPATYLSSLGSGNSTGGGHHPHLWNSYTTTEQQKRALERVLPYIDQLAKSLNVKKWGNSKKWERRYVLKPSDCSLMTMGTDWGSHELCDRKEDARPCYFVSVGISTDYSFDTDMADRWQCRGFAADPTIVHNSSLHPLVTFHNLGATLLESNDEQTQMEVPWWTVSMPTVVRHVLRVPHLQVLKMDCEGCEYALPRDVLREDPAFFQGIDQLAIEVHVSRQWLDNDKTLYYLGVLLELLDQAGLRLQVAQLTECGKPHEQRGCHEQLVQRGLPCGWNNDTQEGYSCHNYLFARY